MMTSLVFYIVEPCAAHNTSMIKRDYPNEIVRNIEDGEILKKEVRRDG